MRRLIPCLLWLTWTPLLATAQDTAVLTWQHPTEYTDDTPLALNDIAATEIEYWLCPPMESETKLLEIPAPTTYIVTVPLPVPGLWCFRARTRVFGPYYSDWTEVVTRVSPAPPYEGVGLPPFQLVM